MRIAVLAGLLALLLGLSLGSASAGPVLLPLHPTPDFPTTSGNARLDVQGERVALTLTIQGLPTAATPATRGKPVYVAWLVDAEQHLVNLGPLFVDANGNVTQFLGPVSVNPAQVMLAVSAEPRADVAAPDRQQAAVLLWGQLADSRQEGLRHVARDLGPSWFVPLLPAALGLTLLRSARRLAAAR